MDDADAFMALVLENTQSELHPLEEGLHALKSGMSGSEYARRIGKPQPTVAFRIQAARVAAAISYEIAALRPFWRGLAEIHAAPEWLWPALAGEMAAKKWTVEKTRQAVAWVAGAAPPPSAA
jgi:ParB-like chromosome segregation protein Spo0J